MLAAKQNAWFSIGRGGAKLKSLFHYVHIHRAGVCRPGTDKDRDGLKNNGKEY